MKLRADDLAIRLSNGLAPVYVISGDEPLQRADALTLIRDTARTQGFEERLRLTAGTGFDWMELLALNDSLSLFASRRLIELELPTGKPGDAGAKALVEYCGRLNPDNVLLVTAPKLDRSRLASKWYKTLDSAGVSIQVWPIDPPRLPRWLCDRGARHGLKLSSAAARLLAERTEGNLLAADQELAKLALLNPGQGDTAVDIDAEQIMHAVGASSRYSVFDMVDAALLGDARRAVKVLNGLRDEGVEPPVMVWALSRETRALVRMKARLDAGDALGQVLAAERVWNARKQPVSSALNRTSATELGNLVSGLANIDRIGKGAAPGNAWDELTRVTSGLAGVRV